MPRSAASDLVLHCLHMSHKKDAYMSRDMLFPIMGMRD